MSGSGGDDSVRVTIGADASKYVDGVQAAGDASTNLSGTLKATSAAVSMSSKEMLDAATRVAAMSVPLAKGEFDFAKVATTALAAGAALRDVAKFTGFPVESIKAFSTALNAALQDLRGTTAAATQASVATEGMAQATDHAARLEATCAAALANLATQNTQVASSANNVSNALGGMATSVQRGGLTLQQYVDATRGVTKETEYAARGMKDGMASVQTFAQALGMVPTPLQALNGLMSANAAVAADMKAKLDALAGGFGNLVPPVNENEAGLRAEIDAMNRARSAAVSAGIDFEKMGRSTKLTSDQLIAAADAEKAFIKSLSPDQVERLTSAMQNNSTTAERMAASVAELRSAETGAFVPSEALLLSMIRQRNAATTAGAEFKRLTDAFAQSGGAAGQTQQYYDDLAAELDHTKQSAKQLNDATLGLEPTLKHGSAAAGGMAREFVVLGHELMSTDISLSRVAGTLVVMAERSGGLMAKIADLAASMTPFRIAGIAAAGAVAAAFAYLVSQIHATETAMNSVYRTALLAGTGAKETETAARAMVETMAETGQVSRSEATKMSKAISGIGSIALETKKRIAEAGPMLKDLLNEDDAEKFSTKLVDIFGSGGGLKAFVDENKLAAGEAHKEFLAALRTDDIDRAVNIAMDGLNAYAKPGWDKWLAKAKEAKANADMIMASGVDAPPSLMQGTGETKPPLRIPDEGAKRQSEQEILNMKAVEEGNAEYDRRDDLIVKLKREQDAYNAAQTAGNRVGMETAQTAIRATEAAIQMWKAQGDATWAAKQQQALDLILTKLATGAKSAKALAEDENSARIQFWDEAAKQSGLTESQVTQAQANASRARLALASQELRALDAGQQTFVQKQQEALTAILADVDKHATSRKQLAMDENRARIAFWDAQSQRSDLTEREISAAHIEGARARMALSKEELGTSESGSATWMARQQEALSEQLVAVAANAKSSRALMEDENRTRIAFWDNAAKQSGLSEKEVTAARAEANRARLALAGEELRGGENAAKQALAVKLATLTEEQAANRDSYAKVMEIEQQKVNLLRAAGASEAKQLEHELTLQDNMVREHAEKQAEIAAQGLQKKRQADAAQLASFKAALDVEVTMDRMSKAMQERALQAYAMKQQAIELESLNNLIATLPEESKIRAAQLEELSTLKAQFAQKDAQYNAKMVADQKASWQSMTAPVESAISGEVSAMLRGTETIGQAVSKMAGDIIVTYAQMGAKKLMQLAADRTMEVLWTGQTEAGKTAVALSGASAREAITTAETAQENTGLLARLAHWIASETGITAAVATGAAEQTAAKQSARAAGSAAEVATGSASVMNAAYQAAAHTYASVSAIPLVGWIMAPPAAAAAFTAVAAYNTMTSLDVGAWNLPRDMPANLHAGEMVIPANFASGIRRGVGGGASQTLNYAPRISGGGADMAGAMRAQSQQFKSYLWHATRNGGLALPGRG